MHVKWRFDRAGADLYRAGPGDAGIGRSNRHGGGTSRYGGLGPGQAMASEVCIDYSSFRPRGRAFIEKDQLQS